MEWKFGWKHEYWDGHAHISPRSHGILVKIPVKKRRIKTNFEIQAVSEDFFDELVETLIEKEDFGAAWLRWKYDY